jgi:replicative DNA helicase
MTADAVTAAPRLYRLGDILEAFDSFADRLERARNAGYPMGPVTGFELIDRELCGHLQPGLHILKGNTGAGKSAFALQVAAECQYPALFVSCEMSALELLRRHTARVNEVSLSRFKDPSHANPLSADEMKRLARAAAEQAPALLIVDATQAWAHPDYIAEQAELLREDREGEGVLIVIDSLHSWARGIEGREEYARLELAIDTLQRVANRVAAPVLAVSEQTKEGNRQGATSGALASAGHRVIGYGAETVIGLYAEDEEVDAYGERIVTLKLDKNRNGAAGRSVKLKFHGGYMRFREA